MYYWIVARCKELRWNEDTAQQWKWYYYWKYHLIKSLSGQDFKTPMIGKYCTPLIVVFQLWEWGILRGRLFCCILTDDVTRRHTTVKSEDKDLSDFQETIVFPILSETPCWFLRNNSSLYQLIHGMLTVGLFNTDRNSYINDTFISIIFHS